MRVCTLLLIVAAGLGLASAAQEETNATGNSTVTSKKLYTYAGPLLPPEWQVVSVLNDRAVIGFTNGSARSAPMVELDSKDRTFLQRLQNGTVYSTPLSSAKEKIGQWSSSVTSTVSKFGKSLKDQIDGLLSNRDKNKDNSTISTTIQTTNLTSFVAE